MYYTSKTEYQCFNARGAYVGTAFDTWQAAELAGEGGTIAVELRVGERTWRVRNGVAERTA